MTKVVLIRPKLWIFKEENSNRALVRDGSEKYPDDDVGGLPSDKWKPLIEWEKYEEIRRVADQALRQWQMYCTEMSRKDLKDIKHTEADELRRCLVIMDQEN